MHVYELYIMRHGAAALADPAGGSDAERGLTPRGIRRLKTIARGLDRLDLGIERIVSSPVVRARETARIVAQGLGLEDALEFSDVLQTGASAGAVQRFLHGRAESRLLVIGHNPTLSELVGRLVEGDGSRPSIELKKGGVAALRGSAPTAELMELAWLATPRLFRRLGAD